MIYIKNLEILKTINADILWHGLMQEVAPNIKGGEAPGTAKHLKCSCDICKRVISK